MEHIDKLYFDESIEKIICKLNKLEEKLQNYEAHNVDHVCENELLDNQDVCQLLKISKLTLQRYRREKKISYQVIGKKCYYNRQDVQSFIKDYHEKFRAVAFNKIQRDKLI